MSVRFHLSAARLRSALGAAALLWAVVPSVTGAQQLPVDRLGAIHARNIGPAGMSGRVAAVDVVRSDPTQIFVGSATGGVFKSEDGGVSWSPVFDEQPVLGVGAISVFQANPDIVWVGTGEGNPRNSAGVGDGIYKSVDGGHTWRLMGLTGSERIARVVTHPTDPDVVWVGVMGPAWSDGEVRGVYRTTDGGESWERVLWVDEGTGVADLVLDPTNPDKLFAAMWDFRRDPWFFRSGGPGSGLFVTRDGGDTWDRLGPEEGLPEGDLGRIGLAIAQSDPDVVYALVEATRSALLRSDDGGRSFHVISDRQGVAPRPFYYADLRVDPENENRLYSLHSSIQVSEDQGRTFRTVVSSGIIHGDVHELWIDPSDSRHMIMGNDGGIGITWNRGEDWRFVENLTLAQFYHVSLDDAVPFNIYGGLQDNGSWWGPNDVWESKGILNAHWHRVGGGDGFSVYPDPTDPRYGYSMSQQGSLQRFDRVTGNRVSIQPVHPDGIPLRFNWNAGLSLDPTDSTALYLGSQFLHRTTDHGDSWEILSPDLTTDDPARQRQDVSGGLTLDATGAENYTTIIDISPSPLEDGTIWVGTDDGNVQLTRDDGGRWTNVVGNIAGAPPTGWVSDIEPSNHAPGTAYVSFDQHRRGDWTPYLFRTTDYGATWERLGTDIEGFIHAVEEDPAEPALLFAGTEFGLWVSFDRGASWQKWPWVPSMPIRDLEIHPRDVDLVLASHGRGAWVLDDIRPLRALASDPALAERAVAAFQPAPAILHAEDEGLGYRSTGMAMWQGETRPYGALLSYWVGAPAARARLEVTDAQGHVVATLSGSGETGLQRVVWDLRARGDADEASGVPEGSEVLPGEYRVSVEVGGERDTTMLSVVDDPRVPAPDMAARRERLRAVAEADALSETAQTAQRRLADALRGVETVLGTLDAGEESLRADGETLRDSLQAVQRRVFTGPECQGICGGETLAAPVRGPLFRLRSGVGAVTPLERLLMDQASTALDAVLEAVNGALTGPVASYREALRSAGYTPLPDTEPVRRPGG